MPNAEAPSLQRDGDTLHLRGDLVVGVLTALWPSALATLPGVRRFDLSAIARVDSAGVAFLAELAQRAGGVEMNGDPPGLAALRAAYRLTPTLSYA